MEDFLVEHRDVYCQCWSGNNSTPIYETIAVNNILPNINGFLLLLGRYWRIRNKNQTLESLSSNSVLSSRSKSLTISLSCMTLNFSYLLERGLEFGDIVIIYACYFTFYLIDSQYVLLTTLSLINFISVKFLLIFCMISR